MRDDLMTPDEVCALLKVTKDWLYDQVQARQIPHVRLGLHLRFRRSEVLDCVRANSVAQDAEPRHP
jgi:excisionase family DNA binding protein